MVQLKINGLDAYTTYGITMDSSSLATLMTPPALKDWVTSESRTEHGTRVVVAGPKYMKARDLTLQINISARTEEDFLSKYASFCEVLKGGTLTLETITGKYYCIYISCNQFSQFLRGIGKFTLKLQEYNPNNRT